MACRAGFVDSISFNRSSGGVHKWSCWSDLYCAVNKSCFMLINMYAGSGVVNAVNDIVGTLPETIGNLTCANRISKLYVHPTLVAAFICSKVTCESIGCCANRLSCLCAGSFINGNKGLRGCGRPHQRNE